MWLTSAFLRVVARPTALLQRGFSIAGLNNNHNTHTQKQLEQPLLYDMRGTAVAHEVVLSLSSLPRWRGVDRRNNTACAGTVSIPLGVVPLTPLRWLAAVGLSQGAGDGVLLCPLLLLFPLCLQTTALFWCSCVCVLENETFIIDGKHDPLYFSEPAPISPRERDNFACCQLCSRVLCVDPTAVSQVISVKLLASSNTSSAFVMAHITFASSRMCTLWAALMADVSSILQ